MGRRGPKAKQVDPTRSDSGKFPDPPEGLTKDAKKIWYDIVSDFVPGHFQPKHFPLLEVFCEASARHSQARTQLDKEGLTVKNERTGVVKKNPLLNIIADESQKMVSLSTKLSLNIPAQRAARAEKPSYKRRPAGMLAGTPGHQFTPEGNE